MRSIVLIAHNIRSIHNVGSLLRTADGLGVKEILFSGYTPYPYLDADNRLPHVYKKLTSAISKTALGSEKTVPFRHTENILTSISDLKNNDYTVVGLEQNSASTSLELYNPPDKIALIIGEEVHGISTELIEHCDSIVEIPMFGQKESFNVSVAAGIALFHLRTFR